MFLFVSVGIEVMEVPLDSAVFLTPRPSAPVANLLALGFATRNKMNTFVGAFKNQLVVAAICGGAAIVAVLVFICRLIPFIWRVFTSWARPRAPVVAEKFRQLAETTEKQIVGQAGQRTDSPM